MHTKFKIYVWVMNEMSLFTALGMPEYVAILRLVDLVRDMQGSNTVAGTHTEGSNSRNRPSTRLTGSTLVEVIRFVQLRLFDLR